MKSNTTDFGKRLTCYFVWSVEDYHPAAISSPFTPNLPAGESWGAANYSQKNPRSIRTSDDNDPSLSVVCAQLTDHGLLYRQEGSTDSGLISWEEAIRVGDEEKDIGVRRYE